MALNQKLAASFGAKNPPDIMYMWNFPAYYESLEPLNQYIEGDAEMDMDDFYKDCLIIPAWMEKFTVCLLDLQQRYVF